MMAENGGKARIVQVTAGEALGAQIAETMVQRALELLRSAGYPKLTPETSTMLSRATVRTALALGGLITDAVGAGEPAPSDDEIDGMAERLAYVVVRETFGPPPQVN